MCQQEYWLEMYETENQKNEKRFLQRFKDLKDYDENDWSNEACIYRAALKFHKRAAIKKVEEKMSKMDLDCNFIIKEIL